LALTPHGLFGYNVEDGAEFGEELTETFDQLGKLDALFEATCVDTAWWSVTVAKCNATV